MADDIYTADERLLLEAWFNGKALTLEQEALLQGQGFDHECCKACTLLHAHPFTTDDGSQRLSADCRPWSTGAVDAAVPYFERLAVRASDISRNELQAWLTSR